MEIKGIMKKGLPMTAELKSLKEMIEKRSTYPEMVKSHLIDIIMQEGGVSEKAFSEVESITNEVESLWMDSEEVTETVKSFEEEGHRSQYCAEEIFSRMEWETGEKKDSDEEEGEEEDESDEDWEDSDPGEGSDDEEDEEESDEED
jgi:hypothetical protein